MSEFKIDSEKVKESIDTLKKLLDKCEEAYDKEIPKSDVDKGSSHKELDELCENMKTTCQYLGELINNTIRFLNGSSEMFDTSDRESANEISDGSATDTSGGAYGSTSTIGGHSGSSSSSYDKYNAQQTKKMEEMLASRTRVDTSKYQDNTYYSYYDSQGIFRENWGVYRNTDGCTWYAYNRYQEMNPDTGHMFSGSHGGNANHWVNSIDRNKFDVLSTEDSSIIKCNTIAVSTQSDTYDGSGIRASGNHVAYVEAVSDGYVYYTDGSYGKDESTFGYVIKVPIDVFQRDYEYIISAKTVSNKAI